MKASKEQEKTPSQQHDERLAAYLSTVKAIASAVRTLKDALGEEDNGYVPAGDGPYDARISPATFCLSTAHQLWRETQNPERYLEIPPEKSVHAHILDMADGLSAERLQFLIDDLNELLDENGGLGVEIDDEPV